MTMAELETAVRERLPITVLVFDNRRFGTIRAHQEARGAGEGIATELGPIDFAGIAEACGGVGFRVGGDAEFEETLSTALKARRPAVLHLDLDRRWLSIDRRADEPTVEARSATGAARAPSEDGVTDEGQRPIPDEAPPPGEPSPPAPEEPGPGEPEEPAPGEPAAPEQPEPTVPEEVPPPEEPEGAPVAASREEPASIATEG